MSAVDKALDVLFCVAGARRDIGVTELCRLCGLDKATVFRSLKALQQRALIEQDPDSRKYRLGLATIRLAGDKLRGLSVARVAQPFMTQLSQVTGETVQLSVRQGNQVLYLSVVESAQPIRVASNVGTLGPIHATAAGKIFLAYSPLGVRALVAEQPLEALTANTITDLDQLEHELQTVRERGWSQDDEELSLHLRAVAAPIRDLNGHVIAAVAVGGPLARVGLERLPELAQAVTTSARAIGSALMLTRNSPETGTA